MILWIGLRYFQKRRREIRDVAAELLDMYSTEAKKGLRFTMIATNFAQFSATFPFEETQRSRDSD